MILSINQPAYLPWLGYFHRLKISDVHVILDHVQFEKNSLTNRNKIRVKEGSLMLTIPLKTKGLFGNLPISNIEIANDSWQAKHLKSIQGAYSKSKFFKCYGDALAELFQPTYKRLIDAIIPINSWMMKELRIETNLVRSSSLEIVGTKSELILNICKSFNATTYLSGPFGRNYLNLQSFENAGIKIAFHDYVHPTYEQTYPGFESYMCALDLLFNHGPASSEILHSIKDASELSK